MSRRKKLLLNTISGIIYQVVTLVCGFILPRFFLEYYGSEVNGLVSSITQFLGFITLAECGVGAVVQSTLYKPLANNDKDEVSRIVVSADRFFKKIAGILIIYIVGLCVFYPLLVNKSFDFIFTASLILVVSISLFAQYYFSMSYRLLMNADQIGFIQVFAQIIALILNTVLSVVLIKNGVGVHVVKFTTSLLHLIPPFIVIWYVKRHYKINKKIEIKEEPIKQKWNGMAQHVSSVVLDNTDVVVLTGFSTLANVSIYNVYHLVVKGVSNLISSATNGVQAMFGNMLAKKETIQLEKSFSLYEILLHFIVTILFTCAGILIVPFVRVYTHGIADVNYIVPTFAIILTIAQASYCLRLPYNTMVLAAGHYKQTQASAIIEAIINIVVSVILVIGFGLVGVAIGTLVAMLYRTIYFAIYLSKHILKRNIFHFIKNIFVDIVVVGVSILACCWLKLGAVNFGSWIVMAMQCAIIVIAIALLINFIFYFKKFKTLIAIIKNKIYNRIKNKKVKGE